MKRVLAFASALALAVGAFAPAAFAYDNVPAQISLTDLYADPELYDLYVAPYYNNLSFSDWGDYATDAVISGFPMNTVKQIESTEGALESLWNTVHDAFSFGYNIGQDWVSKLYVDTSDGRLKSDGNIMTDDLKALLDQYFKSSGDIQGGSFTIGSGTWVTAPYSPVYSTRYQTSYTWQGSKESGSSPVFYDAFMTSYQGGIIVCSWRTNTFYFYSNVTNNISLGQANYNINVGGVNYKYGYVSNYALPNIGVQYSSYTAARDDFYNHQQPTAEPTWNGDGYYRDDYVVDVALPALPAIDWADLSNKYYTEYGGDFIDGDVNNFYYDISYNYFPAEYTYTIPYWLIDGNTSVLDFNYSLELPSVELYELPSEFGGGEEVWDSSFNMLGGFGAFILLGFSFGLVALFFKD